jgi:hypothetical protein
MRVVILLIFLTIVVVATSRANSTLPGAGIDIEQYKRRLEKAKLKRKKLLKEKPHLLEEARAASGQPSIISVDSDTIKSKTKSKKEPVKNKDIKQDFKRKIKKKEESSLDF